MAQRFPECGIKPVTQVVFIFFLLFFFSFGPHVCFHIWNDLKSLLIPQEDVTRQEVTFHGEIDLVRNRTILEDL